MDWYPKKLFQHIFSAGTVCTVESLVKIHSNQMAIRSNEL